MIQKLLEGDLILLGRGWCIFFFCSLSGPNMKNSVLRFAWWYLQHMSKGSPHVMYVTLLYEISTCIAHIHFVYFHWQSSTNPQSYSYLINFTFPLYPLFQQSYVFLLCLLIMLLFLSRTVFNHPRERRYQHLNRDQNQQPHLLLWTSLDSVQKEQHRPLKSAGQNTNQ